MSKQDPVKKMAELLKMGALMLSETCPVKGCNLPLFKMPSGEIICPVHGRVYIVRTEEEAVEVTKTVAMSQVLDSLEDKVLRILDASIREEYPEPTDLIKWLEVLERIRRLKEGLREKKPEEK